MHEKGIRQSIPTSVCFFEQNPISLNYLNRLVPGSEFEVVSEEEAHGGQSASLSKRLVLVVDEQILAPERRLLMRSVRARFPEAKLLVLGRESPHGEACQLLFGTDGFVLYAEAKEKLIPALRSLRDGHLWHPVEVLDYFARLGIRGLRPENRKAMPLTSRETELIPLLTQGLSNKEIANNLGISERTVKFHVANVLAKLGAADRHSAAQIVHSLYALEERRDSAAEPAVPVHVKAKGPTHATIGRSEGKGQSRVARPPLLTRRSGTGRADLGGPTPFRPSR